MLRAADKCEPDQKEESGCNVGMQNFALPRSLIIDFETPAMLADVAAPRQKL